MMSKRHKRKNNNHNNKSILFLLGRIPYHILILIQSLLIWCTGTTRRELPEHLRKPYAGLGTMAIVSTSLATFGGYTFILISLGSPLGGIVGGLAAGSFMWGMDRSVLGFPTPVNKNSNSKLNGSFWVKLTVNIAFSSILTVPLSTLMLMGAVQVKNIEQVEDKIEKIDIKLDNKEIALAEIAKKLDYYDSNSQLRVTVIDGEPKPNTQFIDGHEATQQTDEQTRAEKQLLLEEKQELKQQITAYEDGDLSKSSLKFPEQFNHVMTEARWTDNVLSFLFFTITALMGSGAVLIKTFVFTDDANSKRLERLEKEAKEEEQLKYVMKTSANQICYSVFNAEAMDEDLGNKLKTMQKQFETEVVELHQSFYDGRLAKMRTNIANQAAEEKISLINNSINNVNSHNGNTKYNVPSNKSSFNGVKSSHNGQSDVATENDIINFLNNTKK